MMNPQLIAIALLAIIVVSNFIDFKSLLKNAQPVPPDKVNNEVPVKPSFPDDNQACDVSIACGVKLWEQFKKHCDAAGLKTASAKLDEFFPLLIQKD